MLSNEGHTVLTDHQPGWSLALMLILCLVYHQLSKTSKKSTEHLRPGWVLVRKRWQIPSISWLVSKLNCSLSKKWLGLWIELVRFVLLIYFEVCFYMKNLVIHRLRDRFDFEPFKLSIDIFYIDSQKTSFAQNLDMKHSSVETNSISILHKVIIHIHYDVWFIDISNVETNPQT